MSQRLFDEIKRIVDDTLAGVHTAMPGTIVSAGGMTAAVKPSVTFQSPDGKSMAYPSLSGCPIVMPMAADGKTGLAFPVKAGDACLIVCCESTLSEWQSGNYQATTRHGLSNAVCVPCLLKSAPEAVSRAKSKNATIMFSEENEVMCGEEEISLKYKDDITVKVDDNGILATVKDDTTVKVAEKEVVVEAGDEEHSICLTEDEFFARLKDARVTISDESACLQFDDDRKAEIQSGNMKIQLNDDIRAELSESRVGLYFDAGHYIEVNSSKTHIEGDLDVSGSISQGG